MIETAATSKQWALVTGACSGLGLAIALELAARGYSLVVLSNRCGEIEAVAQRIRTEYGVRAESMHMDLARPEAALELYAAVAQRGLEVEVLISNAGIFFFGEVVETDPARMKAMLQLHVVTPSLLARHFGRDMRSRGSGHIMFVSSASTWKDFPGTACYGSSKRYIRSFATALRDELRPWGVNVTCLAPGAVSTDLYDRTSHAAQVAARFGLLREPQGVARAAVTGMLRRRALVLPGVGAKSMAVGLALVPRWLIRAVRLHTEYLPKPER
jgi:short-subunit dehydrogenase